MAKTRIIHGISAHLRESMQQNEEERAVNHAVRTYLSTEAGELWRNTPEGRAWIANRLRRYPGLLVDLNARRAQ